MHQQAFASNYAPVTIAKHHGGSSQAWTFPMAPWGHRGGTPRLLGTISCPTPSLPQRPGFGDGDRRRGRFIDQHHIPLKKWFWAYTLTFSVLADGQTFATGISFSWYDQWILYQWFQVSLQPSCVCLLYWSSAQENGFWCLNLDSPKHKCICSAGKRSHFGVYRLRT